jgi:NAD(P)-dependent dehydrogenase (short-subunit alcohol dehydrogenase family)
MKKKVLLTGGSRGIGKAIYEELNTEFEVISPTSEELDLSSLSSIDNYFNTISGCNKISEDGSNQFIKSVKCNQVYAPCDNLKVSFKTMSNEIEKMVTAKPKYGSKK